MGYGTGLHDWNTDELEPMKLSLSHCLSGYPSLLYVTQPIVADQHVPSRRAVLGLRLFRTWASLCNDDLQQAANPSIVLPTLGWPS